MIPRRTRKWDIAIEADQQRGVEGSLYSLWARWRGLVKGGDEPDCLPLFSPDLLAEVAPVLVNFYR